jgi:tryptophanyl-tRNA synthetase
MAADILLYDSNLVPVGKDQKQHLEVTRDLAVKLNETYGEGTAIPAGCDHPRGHRRRARDRMAQKMSKSYGNTLPLFGEEKPLKKLIMKEIVTDSTPLEDPKPIENSTILGLYKLFASPEAYQLLVDQHLSGGFGYGHFKKDLAEAYWNYFAPMRARREEIIADPGYVDSVLKRGAERAREEASKVLTRVRKAVGLA